MAPSSTVRSRIHFEIFDTLVLQSGVQPALEDLEPKEALNGRDNTAAFCCRRRNAVFSTTGGARLCGTFFAARDVGCLGRKSHTGQL